MTPEKVALVQTSFKKVAPIADTAADIFYARLFEIAPEVRSLFPEQMGDQKKKLMQMLATAVNNLHKVETIVPAVQDLGRRHVAYGVKDAHYDTVGAALLYTLEKGLGEDWTPEVADAWTETYGIVATTMKTAAAEVPTEPEKKKGFLGRLFSN
ncbi:globin family protein [Albimonas pacifica]|uniref:Hemoglobin-like flavoprotein n=1 Tax=Albimonas pacifica TaxID=1114924 RepID=A0A1I3GGU1_9RHOB|nr:globin family protein [Albimonas pacifica]SFI22735.1 Hemoglobin-like flavoprotein [Albimonas pacifica]